MSRLAKQVTGAYLALIGVILAAYAFHAQFRGGKEIVYPYGVVLFVLGLPWSWASLYATSGDLALFLLFAGLAVNALLLYCGSAWWARREPRDRAN